MIFGSQEICSVQADVGSKRTRYKLDPVYVIVQNVVLGDWRFLQSNSSVWSKTNCATYKVYFFVEERL